MFRINLWIIFSLLPSFLCSQDYQTLRAVFGSTRLETHNLTPETLSSLLHHKKITRKLQEISPEDEVKEDEVREDELYVVCSESRHSLNIKKFITELKGKENIHTVYTSKNEDSICFITLLNEEIIPKVSESIGVKSCTFVPYELKIHDSMMYFLGIINQNHQSFHNLSKRYKRKSIIDLTHAKIVISSGVGVPSKTLSKPENAIRLEDIQNLLFQTRQNSFHISPSSHLYHFASLHSGSSSPETNIWYQHAESLSRVERLLKGQTLLTSHLRDGNEHNTDDICLFSKLSIEHTGHSVVLSNIGELKHAQESSACYASLLSLLVTTKFVGDIRFRFPKRAFNNYNKGIIQENLREENYPYTSLAGLNGTGQVIGIGDTGVDQMSCFFRNSDGSKVTQSSYTNPVTDLTKRKVVQYIDYADGGDTEGGHGTHVSGTIAGQLIGSNATYVNYDGHGAGAKIAFFDMEKSSHPEYGILYPSPISNVFTCAYSAGAKLHSNSWGGSVNAYDDDTIDMDAYLVKHSDFLIMFAAGNDGSDGYYSIGDPAVSKNVVTVGATMSSASVDIGKLAFFSSLGPTFDSRIKPDVVAPGYFTWSAKASGSSAQTCEITKMAGTSMATPCVTGVAAQIRQYFTDYDSSQTGCTYSVGVLAPRPCQNSNPLGATIKALLVHSGEKMDSYDAGSFATTEPSAVLSNPPDMYQGFGRVSLKNILPYPGIEDILKIHVSEVTLGSLQVYTTKIQIADSSRPFKATLVYMDPANTIMSTKMLINNLDLIVEDPLGNIYYGNGMAGDDVNNVEQVSIFNPPTGSEEWTIRVVSDVLPESTGSTSDNTQDFSLTISAGGMTFVNHSLSDLTVYNPAACTSSQQFVQMTLLDNGGDGWGTGNSYSLIDRSTGEVVQSGTMSSAVPSDLLVMKSFCLDIGEYSVNLIRLGNNSNEMGLEIGQCDLYLSKYQSSGTLSITSNHTCNTCKHYSLIMTLVGSLYGVPYGWKNTSHYTITQTKNPDGDNFSEIKGTLLASPFLDHVVCLSDGTYQVTMNDIPLSDDFIQDDYYGAASQVGVEEYRIYFANNKKYKMKQNQKAIITVTGTTATIKIESPSNAEKYKLSAGAVAGVVLASIVLFGALFVVFFDTTAAIHKIKSLAGIKVSSPDDAPLVEDGM